MARSLRYSLFWTVLNFFAFLLQQATVMAKHTCDTYQKHAKVTNVFSFPVDVSVSGVESQAGVRKATTCPSHQRQKKTCKARSRNMKLGVGRKSKRAELTRGTTLWLSFKMRAKALQAVSLEIWLLLVLVTVCRLFLQAGKEARPKFMVALFGRDVLSSTLTMKVNSCNIESLAFWHGTKSQIQLVLDSFEFFRFSTAASDCHGKAHMRHLPETCKSHQRVLVPRGCIRLRG